MTYIQCSGGGGGCTSGTYTGNGTVNKGIIHDLTSIPKNVIIYPRDLTKSWMIELIQIGYIYGTWNSGYSKLTVTPWDTTKFYVGNATNYHGSANVLGAVYDWVAFK